ncbi:homeobox protein cut-like 2 [Danio aesculapii]|uniref:homeobox protein cut-like 2 n=1 Tax=Danio aesculapii TaxID=1142201 RepID=UPI0024BF1745|nr:homeobox protein cut-like 2 [Danio aesculapii]
MKRLLDFSSDGLEKIFIRRDQEVQRLEQEVQRLQRRLQEVQERTANHITLLQQQLANKTQDVERLQVKLQSQQDYEKIKTELRSLRALKQTDLHVDLVSPAPPTDVRCVSVENDDVIEVQVKTPDFHLSFGQEEELNESFSIISGHPMKNSRSSSSSSPGSLQMVIKADPDSDVFRDSDEQELDTLQVTQQVKQALQSRNIGQRAFGHYVLGLSQGSVSDILARPKPWSKLTQRGKEPFLRMKHFLSDEQAMRTLSEIQETLRGLAPCVRPAEVSSDQAIRNILDQSRLEMLDEELRSVHSSSSSDASENAIRIILQGAQQQMHTNQSPITLEEQIHCRTLDPSVQTPADFVQGIIQKVKYEIDEDVQPPVSLTSMNQTLHGWSVENRDAEEQFCSSPTISSLDLQNLELDTFSITQRVKKTLIVHNIGQRVFGEEVLGLTQSSVSELLSHPKPWTKLSLKGKENFIRMHLWLLDPHSIQKLNAKKKSDQRARLKRDYQSVCESLQCSDVWRVDALKRPRVVLSVQEKQTLLSAYELEPYPSQNTIDRLAVQLGLQTSTVSNWFYNYRSRIRRDGFCEPTQVSRSESPAGLSLLSLASAAVKQEPRDPEADEHTDGHVSVGIQSFMRLKEEKEEDLNSFCSSF